MSFPATDPEQVVITRLDAAVAGLTAATNLFRGPTRPVGAGIPALAVFVQCYGGRPSPDMGAPSDDHHHRLQVRVRGDVDGYSAALDLAKLCLAACYRYDPPESGYIELQTTDSAPLLLRLDDTEHPTFVFNCRLTFSG